MNAFLPERYGEYVHRLALGLELVDADRGTRVGHPVGVAVEGVPPGLPPERGPHRFGETDVLGRVARHDTALYSLIYRKGLYRRRGEESFLTLRFMSPERRFVPRRVRFPLLHPDAAAQADEAKPIAGDPTLLGRHRIRRVALFPGAAYDVPCAVTGLRGRCRRPDGTPVRWVTVEARMQDGPGTLVGRARGDDRGEFLLLLRAGASGVGPLDLGAGVRVVLNLFAPAPGPVVPAATRAADPLWDLPFETVTGPGPADPVSLGEAPLAGPPTVSRTESFVLGRCRTSDVPPIPFP